MIATTSSTTAAEDSPTLLLFTGWCDDRRQFDPLLEATGRHRRTISLDWRGHGGSPPAPGDFGTAELVADALEVIDREHLDRVVPVAVSHAGWVALELSRALGERVPAVVLVDWMVLGPPPGFSDALRALQSPTTWEAVRADLVALWTDGVSHPGVLDSVRRMQRHDHDMWARAGREIDRSFSAAPVPLEAFAELARPVQHLYAQPADPGFLAAQRKFAEHHPWFEVERLNALSHFPMIEVPEEMARLVEEFVRRSA